MSTKTKYYLFNTFTLFTVLLVFWNRDFYYHNELKYVNIVSDALIKKHFFTFYNLGEPYADKPPLYFWLFMIGKVISGKFSPISIGIFNIIAACGVITVMNKMVEKQLDDNDRICASIMLMTTGLFIGGVISVRMDIIMCFFIVASMFLFYRIYSEESKPYELYLFYVAVFLGIFTKGPVALLFPVVSIALFAIRNRDLSAIKKIKPFRGLAILLILSSIWLLAVYIEGGKEYLYNLTVKQTVGRAYHSFKHAEPFTYYIKKLPLIFLPWSILIITQIVQRFITKEKETELASLFSSTIIANLVVMSLVSSKLSIYLLPIFPFTIYYTILCYKQNKSCKAWQIPLYITAICLMVLPVAIILGTVKHLIPIQLTITTYSVLIAYTFISVKTIQFIKNKSFKNAIFSMALCISAITFGCSLEATKLNPSIGLRVMAENALKLKNKLNSTGFYSYRFGDCRNIIVYGIHCTNIVKPKKMIKILSTENPLIFVENKDVINGKLSPFIKSLELKWSSYAFSIYAPRKVKEKKQKEDYRTRKSVEHSGQS